MTISRLLLLTFGLFISSCGKNLTPQPQALRINISEEPSTLDPRKARNLNDITTCRMLFEGLMRISKTGSVELAIADSVEISEDRLEYIFHLKDALWSNGELVTSYDFAESWKSILDPSFPTDIAYQLYVIENGRQIKSGEKPMSELGVKTPDAQTLIIRLEQPTPYFLEICSMGSFLPVPHKIAAANPNWASDPITFVGNGPFVLDLWTHTDQLKVEKSPTYWDANAITLNKLEIMMVSNETEIQLFENNKLDWAGSPLSTLPVDAVAYLKQTNKLKVSPLSGTYFLRTNTNETIRDKKNPVSCMNFRKALALSIDREAIATHILQGGQTAAHSLVPPDMGLFGEGYFDPAADPKQLLDLALQELSLNRETIEPIVISFVSSDRNTSIAQTVQKQLEKTLGIPFVLEAIESKVFSQKIKQKEFQLAVASWIADFNDPVNFLEVFKFKEGSTNNTGWESAKYIDLLNRSAICGDQDERRQILRQAEEILMDQMPIIPIFHFAMNFLQRDGIEGVALSPIGQIDFRWTTIDAAQHPR